MNRFYFKRRKIALFVVVVLIAASFTGCGRKQVDYEQGYEENIHFAEGPMAKMLSIPSSYDQEISIEGGTALTIHLKDADIQVPKTENMYLVSYVRQMHDSDYHEFVVSALFDEEKEVYTEEEGHPFIGKLEAALPFYQRMLNEATKAGDTDWIDYWQFFISLTDDSYQNAVDTRPLITDYEGWDFYGTMGGDEARVFFSEANYNDSGFDVQLYRYETLIDYRPYEENFQVMIYPSDDDNLSNNACKMKADQAVSEGESVFSKLKLDDLVCSGIYNLSWEYSDYAFENKNIEYDGYYIEYQRGIAGEPIYMPSLQSLEETDTINYISDVREYFAISMDDNKILNVNCFCQYKKTAEEEVKDLISFSEATDALKREMQDYFVEHPSSYQEITLDDIRLTYYMVWNEKKQVIQALPVYVFAHLTRDEAGNKLEQFPDQLFVINALDGNVVDVIENGLNLQTSSQQMYE